MKLQVTKTDKTVELKVAKLCTLYPVYSIESIRVIPRRHEKKEFDRALKDVREEQHEKILSLS